VYRFEGEEMGSIYNDLHERSINTNHERRAGERRVLKHRRSSSKDKRHAGIERRTKSTDRRITIFNRDKMEVTDRRSIN